MTSLGKNSNHLDYGSISNDDSNKSSNKQPSPPSSPVLHYPPPPPTLRQSLKFILTNSWLNVLLIFIPLGYAAHILNWSNTSVFTLNFFAIIPLAKLLEFTTENVGLRVGQVSNDFKQI